MLTLRGIEYDLRTSMGTGVTWDSHSPRRSPPIADPPMPHMTMLLGVNFGGPDMRPRLRPSSRWLGILPIVPSMSLRSHEWIVSSESSIAAL